MTYDGRRPRRTGVRFAALGLAVLVAVGPASALSAHKPKPKPTPRPPQPITVTWTGAGTLPAPPAAAPTASTPTIVLANEVCDADKTPYLDWVLKDATTSAATITVDTAAPVAMTRPKSKKDDGVFTYTWAPDASSAPIDLDALLGKVSATFMPKSDKKSTKKSDKKSDKKDDKRDDDQPRLRIARGCLGEASALRIVFLGELTTTENATDPNAEPVAAFGPLGGSTAVDGPSRATSLSICETGESTNCIDIVDGAAPDAESTLDLVVSPSTLDLTNGTFCKVALLDSPLTAAEVAAFALDPNATPPASLLEELRGDDTTLPASTTTGSFADTDTVYVVHLPSDCGQSGPKSLEIVFLGQSFPGSPYTALTERPTTICEADAATPNCVTFDTGALPDETKTLTLSSATARLDLSQSCSVFLFDTPIASDTDPLQFFLSAWDTVVPASRAPVTAAYPGDTLYLVVLPIGRCPDEDPAVKLVFLGETTTATPVAYTAFNAADGDFIMSGTINKDDPVQFASGAEPTAQHAISLTDVGTLRAATTNTCVLRFFDTPVTAAESRTVPPLLTLGGGQQAAGGLPTADNGETIYIVHDTAPCLTIVFVGDNTLGDSDGDSVDDWSFQPYTSQTLMRFCATGADPCRSFQPDNSPYVMPGEAMVTYLPSSPTTLDVRADCLVWIFDDMPAAARNQVDLVNDTNFVESVYTPGTTTSTWSNGDTVYVVNEPVCG